MEILVSFVKVFLSLVGLCIQGKQELDLLILANTSKLMDCDFLENIRNQKCFQREYKRTILLYPIKSQAKVVGNFCHDDNAVNETFNSLAVASDTSSNVYIHEHLSSVLLVDFRNCLNRYMCHRLHDTLKSHQPVLNLFQPCVAFYLETSRFVLIYERNYQFLYEMQH